MLHAKRHAVVVAVVVWEFALAPALCSARTDGWRLTVRGGAVDLGETPVVAQLKSRPPVGLYNLEPETGTGTLPAQVFRHGDRQFLGTILPRVGARSSEHYTMKPLPAGTADLANRISIRADGATLAVELDRGLVAAYRTDTGNKPFFFPLIGPTGESYTRAFPTLRVEGEDTDHPHQRSCWFTHGNVNGIDFWSEGRRTGTIHESGRTIVPEGPVLGRLETRDEWLGPDQRRICTDVRTVTFYRTSGSRVIDFDFTIHASDGPVEFRDTKEGMFGLRVASSMDVSRKTGGKITNAEGLTDDKAWGQSSAWVDYVGPVKGKTVGIAVLNHPDSFRYPTSWHVRTYGLFAANPFGWHDFGKPERGDYTIPNGGKIDFRYRVILHEGSTDSAGLIRLFEGYARPPSIELKPG
jgi:Methane oxygenase PmoA